MLFYNPRQILETWLVLDWNFSHLPPFLLDTTVFETSSDNCFLLNLLFLSMWNNFFLNSAMFLASTIQHPCISSLISSHWIIKKSNRWKNSGKNGGLSSADNVVCCESEHKTKLKLKSQRLSSISMMLSALSTAKSHGQQQTNNQASACWMTNVVVNNQGQKKS